MTDTTAPASTPATAPRKVLMGLIGSGIQKSLTPAMQEKEAAEHGLRLHYQLIDLDVTKSTVDDLPTLLSAARIMGFAGLNITFPCKQAILPLLDELSDEAAAIGAVNTVVNRNGRLIGHNTDCSGWAFGFQRGLPNADLSRVVLLGTGGAGAAIAHAVMRMDTRQLVLVDVDPKRAADLAQQLNQRYGGQRAVAVTDIAQAMEGASGLIHATPTGMDKMPGLPLPAALLKPSMWVSEVVYFPLETELLKVARAIGCQTVYGGGMAVGQAVGAFELVNGLKADADRMQAHFLSLIA
ncbi:shikimate dehydrogenase [Aquabacterium sp.]|uniref:shikimate dehydrogenase n=1 Tax=Aquabacterium sp. TaxID=1872578 RepID=UPI0025BBFC6B|nr:shikimate dehydrogenase [Aquabacterium sp.]